MRPTKLTLSAFGPYANVEVIDFEKLGTSGIYLISGNTGSGKTMIFDAIVYALYGDSSGGKRQAKDFRSKFADPSVPTYVELEFDYNGKKYVIRRNPEYERLAKKGSSSTTKQSAGVDLTLPNGRIVSKEKEVSSEMNNILHISEEQFKQIIMIAQNSFADVLHSNTEKRTVIFRSLFNTQKYDNLKGILESKNSEANNKYNEAKLYIYNILNAIGLVSTDLKNFAVTDDYLSQIDDGIAQNEKLIQNLTNDIAKINAELSTLDKSLGHKEKDKNTIDTLTRNQSELTVIKEQTLQNKEKLDIAAKQKLDNLDSYNQIITRLTDSLPKYEELDKLTADCNAITKQIDTKTHMYNEISDKIQKTENQLANAQQERNLLENIAQDELELQNQAQNLTGLNTLCDQTTKKLSQFKKKTDELKTNQSELIHKQSDYNTHKNTYDEAYNMFIAQQAGILSRDLTEGMPCPVCGSTTHPHLAPLAENAPTESYLKSMKDKMEQNKKNLDTLSQKCSALLGETALLKSDIDSSVDLLNSKFNQTIVYHDNNSNPDESNNESLKYKFLYDAISALQNQTYDSINKLEKKLSEIKQNKAKKENLTKKIDELTNALGQLNEQKISINNELISLKSKQEHSKADTQRLQKELSFSGKNEAQREIDRMKNLVNGLNKSFDEANKIYTESQTKLTKLEAAINENIVSLGNPPDIESFKNDFNRLYQNDIDKRQKLTDEQKKLDEQKSEYQTLLSNLKDAKQTLQKKLLEWDELTKKKIMINKLYNTVSGNLNSTEKISFETFVQTRYFERVLNRANKRLAIMCDGKYKLIRRTSGSHKGKFGLDLDIKDFYNGQTRDVTTLSGGETFKASLALAFGLSDEIQHTSGGIHIDSMFVDEGFGTLDHESVEWALNALNNVATDNRLIGIISHVDELKNAIDKQIQVTKNNQGISKVNIIV